jgi:S-adenosylmethionine:tRNA ribosyltransferase-isomerase
VLISEFDFHLPEQQIAQDAAPRGDSRLLVLDAHGAARHRNTRDLPAILRPGDLVVVNDTRVFPARLLGRSMPRDAASATPSDAPSTTANVELLLVERRADGTWTALAKPGRRARVGARLAFDGGPAAEILAVAEDGRRTVRFEHDVDPHLERIGHVPLPPYIRRADTTQDRERYQTVFARAPGAIAAPTAGLHFNQAMLEGLRARGIELATVTLHVGIGTFKPITATLVHEHKMESERFEIPAATAEAIRATRARGGRVVAVGTTVVRTLESSALLSGGEPMAGTGATDLYITPGFRFQVVDVLFTNFHLPQSTLLLLTCAFGGTERVLGAYREAVQHGYRFYSYGDAMLAEAMR